MNLASREKVKVLTHGYASYAGKWFAETPYGVLTQANRKFRLCGGSCAGLIPSHVQNSH